MSQYYPKLAGSFARKGLATLADIVTIKRCDKQQKETPLA
jgi:hypothetical protein